MTPSTTGRSGRSYTPTLIGARSVNVNVPIPPGATTGSTVVATRFPESQPTASSVNASESFTTPRFTWRPNDPRTHVSVPVFLKRSV